MKQSYFLIFSVLIIFGCSKEEPVIIEQPIIDELIDPSNSNALSEVLILPAGSQNENGNPPNSSNSNQAPEVLNPINTVLSSNGSTAPLSFSYSNVDGNLGGCYVQIAGADNYFLVPYNSTSNSAGNLQLPLGIPTNVDEGDFCVNFCVYDTNGLISNIVTTCVNVLRLGTGAVQVSLSWNTSSDQDLYVTDPNGEIISYTNTSSSSGGQLDRDDTNGYGPENIYWLDDAPDGTYNVKVNDYSGTSFQNEVYLTVSGPNQSRNFTGTTQNGSTIDIVTFTKVGDNLTF